MVIFLKKKHLVPNFSKLTTNQTNNKRIHTSINLTQIENNNNYDFNSIKTQKNNLT